MKMRKGNGNTTTLFSLKGLEIVHKERGGQVKTIVTNTSTVSSSTSPDLLTSSTSIVDLADFQGKYARNKINFDIF